MPVQISWHEEGVVLKIHYSGNISLEDIKQGSLQSRQYIEGIPTMVYTIVDVTDLKGFPKQITQFGDIIQDIKNSPMQGFMVIVGAKGIARFLGSAVSQMMGVGFRMVDTVAEAENVIQHIRH